MNSFDLMCDIIFLLKYLYYVPTYMIMKLRQLSKAIFGRYVASVYTSAVYICNSTDL